jgi:septal ring-binding cell division protein DamX
MTDLYQSPGDRLRFEILLKSLTEGSINLAVLSDHDRVLDYYGSLFEERLRAKGESHIEFCASTNSERLVQKFNEILSEITLDQALEKDKKHAPRRFLLFRDSILMQDFELQLLARLVNGFPAGNISVILLINSAGNYQSKIAAFGKNLLQWEVETEAGEPTKKLTDWVATEPEPEPVAGPIEPTLLPDPPTLVEEVQPVSKLLNLPTKTAWRVPGFGKKQEPKLDQEPLPAFVPTPEPLPPVTPALTAAQSPAPAFGAALAAAASETSREPTLSASVAPAPAATDAEVFKRQPRKSRAGWVLLVLLMSIAAFGVMYQDLVMQEAEALKKYLLRGTPAVAAPDEAASAAAAAASAASAEALASAELAASVATEAARAANEAEAVASAASAVASQSAVAPVAPLVADASEKKVVEKEAAKETTKESVKESKADAKAKADAQPDSDQAWVDQLPANGYVVQLAAMDTQEEMRSFQRSNAAYAKARILRTRHKDSGKRFFILVAGPFENKSQADTFMQSSPLLAKGWLRSTKSMKTQFTKP